MENQHLVVQIDPRIALAEALAENDWLRNRLLLQAQAIADLCSERSIAAQSDEAEK